MVPDPMSRRTRLLAVTLAATLVMAGCGAQRNAVPPASAQADQFLFERGTAAFKEKKWLQAREYFRQIVDNYPQSPYRPDAKLAVGDTYIGEHSVEALMLGVNEFREFLTFYPTSARADYAQYRARSSRRCRSSSTVIRTARSCRTRRRSCAGPRTV
jgi:outer membrane assembly lipoprotein YfiO